jgi:16S rRNA (guanine(1405)-N(7))-methyltransferase
MSLTEDDLLTRLVEAVLDSSKYRGVAPDFVRTLGAQELRKRRKLKEAVKATKNKLHQVGGAFLDYKPDFAGWLGLLREARDSGDDDALRRACAEVMTHHASTRERMPVLDGFYETTLAGLPPIRSVLDVACGLNPLSIPWMPLAEGADYYAFDIYESMLGFLGECIPLLGAHGHARPCDVTRLCEHPPVELALVLKTIPCLEQVDKAAGGRLLDAIDAEHVLVSFPIQSLCGRSKGMAANYEARFRRLAADKSWHVRRFEFESELVFRVSR